MLVQKHVKQTASMRKVNVNVKSKHKSVYLHGEQSINKQQIVYNVQSGLLQVARHA